MFIISHYKSSYEWVKEYTDSFIVYHKDRLNVGYNLYDIFTFIIDHYDSLPDICIFVKDNILERHITKEEFDKLIHNKTFTPLLTQNHKVYEPVCRYVDGMYEEINDSWYFNKYPHKHFSTYTEFASIMDLPRTDYLAFAPGGNYIVPKRNILKRTKAFYKILRSFIEYSSENAESHAIERSLYSLWK